MTLVHTQYHRTNADIHNDEIAPGQRIVLYDLLLETGAEPVHDRVNALSLEYRDSDAIIMRASRGTTHEELAPLAAAVTARPVWGLLRSNEPFQTYPLNAAARAALFPLNMPTVRNAEVHFLLQRAKAIHREEDPHHYVLPSLLHTDTFVHVGALLQSYTTVHRVADWLEDTLEDHTVLLADTGALVPLLLELQARAKERFDYQPPVYVFDRYPDTILDVQAMIRTIQTRHDMTASHLLFLLSVSSTGRLASWVRAGDQNARIIAVCDTAKEPRTDALVHLPVEHFAHANEAECEVRRTGIDGKTLERIYEAEWHPVPLNRNLAGTQAAFWAAVDRTNALQLHADKPYWADPAGVRHHPVYLDIPTLLTDPAFRAECLDKLRRITPTPHVLLLPTHDVAADAIRSLVTEALGDLTIITAHGTRLEDNAPLVLQTATSILIADDATVTGRTLAGLRRAVYAHIQARHEPVHVFGFVAIQRPPNELLRNNGRNPFPDHHLITGAEVFLPRPSKDYCPWCREQRLLTLFLDELPSTARAYADDRLAMLTNGALVQAPIALGTEQSLPPDARTKDGFFGELRHIAAAGAVSSVIVSMQQRDLRDQGRRFHVFKASSGLAYYDAILTGMIFRTLRPRDLHWSGETADVAEILRVGFDEGSAQPGWFAEVGLAAFEGKLPRAPVEAIYARLPHDPATALISELFALRPDTPS